MKRRERERESGSKVSRGREGKDETTHDSGSDFERYFGVW